MMPSPFPGMDPYLEHPVRWPGVHTSLIVAMQAALNRQLPPHLIAEIDQYVWVEEDEERELLGKPDVFLPSESDGDAGIGYPADPVAVAAPTVAVKLAATTRKKTRIVRIVTADSGSVLTVIELLSPSNKYGSDRDAYLAKRREYFAAQTNLVEIDLLRDGDRLPLGKPRPPAADYLVLVTRGAEYPRARVWAFTVREAIPVIPIPLDLNNPAVPLDLRACLDRVYDEGKYSVKLDYAQTPDPPLRKYDAVWAAELLAVRKG